MPNLEKLVCTWSGPSGSPGYTTFYFAAGSGPTMQPKVVTLWQVIAGYLPPAVNIAVPTGGVILSAETGEANGAWSGGNPGSINGTHTVLTYAPQTGMLCQTFTNAYRRGHRVRGRLFIVPTSTGILTSGGIISQGIANTVKNAMDTLNTPKGNWMVWHRPLMDYSVKPPVQKEPGEAIQVETCNVPTKTTYLHTRRD